MDHVGSSRLVQSFPVLEHNGGVYHGFSDPLHPRPEYRGIQTRSYLVGMEYRLGRVPVVRHGHRGVEILQTCLLQKIWRQGDEPRGGIGISIVYGMCFECGVDKFPWGDLVFFCYVSHASTLFSTHSNLIMAIPFIYFTHERYTMTKIRFRLRKA